MVPVEKLISFHIERQFPAIYRENGQELIQFVKEYYKFLETNPGQAIYNGRRLFEYRDIDTTLERMLIFYKNKYLADLPFNDETIRLIVKNILGLYRRKGTEEALRIFFGIFYAEDIKVYYPARDLFKPSDSSWNSGAYLEIIPNTGLFKSNEIEETFTYRDLIGKTIIGSTSGVNAVVDKINFIIINNSFIPIIYVNKISGQFLGLENILCEKEGTTLTGETKIVPINFGKIYGSLTSLEITDQITIGNEIGDFITITSEAGGIGAKGIVTEISESFSGIVSYEIEDGGWGYTLDTTKLLVSNQIIYLNNENRNFEILETLEDGFGNQGIVIGQNDVSVGVKMNTGNEFTNTSIITTVDRDVNVNIEDFSDTPIRIIEKNDSSPGNLYPETLDSNDVKVGSLKNIQAVSLIFDIIGDFANVALDSADYNTVPPALKAMSGNTTPTTINTVLSDAFDLTPINVGSIETFENINPGADYVNDVFAIAKDERIVNFSRRSQDIRLQTINSVMSVGEEVSQNGIKAKITAINDRIITVIPYTYYGFNEIDDIMYKGTAFTIENISTNYDNPLQGLNAVINSETEFGTGRIVSIKIINSGYGYSHNSTVDIIDSNGTVAAQGIISARGVGTTGGYWTSVNSHLNGYISNNGSLEYYESGKYIQDSEYYQEYSYEIQSRIGIERFEKPLKEITHVAGTKVFGKFNLEEILSAPSTAEIEFDVGVNAGEEEQDTTISIINNNTISIDETITSIDNGLITIDQI